MASTMRSVLSKKDSIFIHLYGHYDSIAREYASSKEEKEAEERETKKTKEERNRKIEKQKETERKK